MYINHAVLKRPLAQWVQVKLFTNVSAATRYTQQFKGAVCRIDIAVQIQNIGEGFFHPAPPPQT